MPLGPGASAAAAAAPGHVTDFILRGRDHAGARTARLRDMQGRAVVVTGLLVRLERQIKAAGPEVLAPLKCRFLRGEALILDPLCAEVVRPFDSVLSHTGQITRTVDTKTSRLFYGLLAHVR